MTLGLFPSMIATHELVVPRSIPMTLQRIGLDNGSLKDLREVSLGGLDDLAAGLGGVLLEYCSQHRG